LSSPLLLILPYQEKQMYAFFLKDKKYIFVFLCLSGGKTKQTLKAAYSKIVYSSMFF